MMTMATVTAAIAGGHPRSLPGLLLVCLEARSVLRANRRMANVIGPDNAGSQAGTDFRGETTNDGYTKR